MKTKEFEVTVIDCNVDVFEANYGRFIKNKVSFVYENTVFVLDAPSYVLDEIKELEEEGIYLTTLVEENKREVSVDSAFRNDYFKRMDSQTLGDDILWFDI